MGEPKSEEDEEDFELEPLFDYRRVQPINFISLDDDFSDSEEGVISPKRLKKLKPTSNKSVVVDTVISDVDKDEEDWLAPPPKTNNGERKSEPEDSTMKALRLKKQELTSLTQSAEDVLREVEEAARKQLTDSIEFSLESEDAVKESKPLDDRKKIVISIQGKEGLNKYRVYMDEKFDKVFKAYAEKVKCDLGSLVFTFDGDKVSVTATPDSLGMEEDDIIEVNTKTR